MGFETTYGIKIEALGLSGAQATAYISGVRKHLSWIDGTKVGRRLLQAIGWQSRNNPGNLTGGVLPIQPYTGTTCNATASNSTSTATGWSRPLVTYSPNVFHKTGSCYTSLKRAETNRGLYPDELLFHELVHAFRGTSARFRAINFAPGGLSGHTGTEEFIAIMTTNIYISDPSNGSKTGLRKDHQGFAKLEAAFADSFGFFRLSKQVFTLVDQFCRENPSFTKWISEIKAPFNPIAAYYQNQNKTKELSNSALALLRDGDVFGLMMKLI